MSKLEIFKDRSFDSTKDNNFEQTEWNENKTNAEDITKKEKDMWEKIKQAKDRLQMIAETEMEDADNLLANLTWEKIKEKTDQNLEKHLAQGNENILDANNDWIPDWEQSKNTNDETRENEENALAQQPVIAKPKEKVNSVLTEHTHATTFWEKNSKQQKQKSAEAWAENMWWLE